MRFNTALEIPSLVENNVTKATELLDIFPRKEQYTVKNVYLFEISGLEYEEDLECSVVYSGGFEFICPLFPYEILEKIHIHNQIDKL